MSGRLSAGVAALLAAFTAQSQIPADSSKVFSGTGVALTPAHFPRQDPEDVEAMFRKGKELGDYAVFIYQWSQPDLHEVARAMLAASRKWGYTPLIAVSPTVLSGMRGELDVPQPVRDRVKGKLTFADPAVHLPYIQTVLDLARLEPPYLCLATEINLLALENVKEYLTFAHVSKRLYPEIKKISPDTQVFVSFQWDTLRVMDQREPDKIAEHGKLIDVFRPELDLVAFTSYPKVRFATPREVPADYYERIFDHVSRSEKVIFMEVGWPSTGSAFGQREFILGLPLLMERVKPSVLAWSLLHDVTGMPGDSGSTGLFTLNGEAKPSFEAFKEIRAR